MKLFESILVLVALAASPVIGDVLANTNPVAPRTPKIKVDPTRTGCDIPLKEHNLLGKQVSLDENLRRLRRDSKVCDVDPRQGCKRVSCVDHTAVFVCAEQTLDRPLALSCDNVADFAEEILRDCNFVLWVKGWAQDKEERFRVEVRWDTTKGKCK